MVNYGLEGRVALVTGANNPEGNGATTALAFAREGAKVVLVYKKIVRAFDAGKTDKCGADRYFAHNASDAGKVEEMLKAIDADYLVIEVDISDEDSVKEIEEKDGVGSLNAPFYRSAVISVDYPRLKGKQLTEPLVKLLA